MTVTEAYDYCMKNVSWLTSCNFTKNKTIIMVTAKFVIVFLLKTLKEVENGYVMIFILNTKIYCLCQWEWIYLVSGNIKIYIFTLIYSFFFYDKQ